SPLSLLFYFSTPLYSSPFLSFLPTLPRLIPPVEQHAGHRSGITVRTTVDGAAVHLAGARITFHGHPLYRRSRLAAAAPSVHVGCPPTPTDRQVTSDGLAGMHAPQTRLVRQLGPRPMTHRRARNRRAESWSKNRRTRG